MGVFHGKSKVLGLGWGLVLLTAALGATLWQVARQDHQADNRWLLGVVGSASMAMEPIRDEVQLLPWADPSPVAAELPGGYPVVANTRPTPVWRGVRRARIEIQP